jgi:hypothetical protein
MAKRTSTRSKAVYDAVIYDSAAPADVDDPYYEVMYAYIATLRSGREVRIGRLFQTKRTLRWANVKRIPVKEFRLHAQAWLRGVTQSQLRELENAVSVRLETIELVTL